MMVRTPRPSSPTSQATASSYSTSADAFDRLPSLSLSRCRRMPFGVPSGRTRGSRKQDSPPGAWASTMNRSPIGAEVNHLWPVSRYSPSPPRHRDGAGGVGPYVGAALLLGHRHARDQAALGLGRPQAEVVLGGRQQRLEAPGQVRRVPQRGHEGVGHRHRAAVPGLGRAPHVEARGPRHVRPGPGVPPRRRVQPVPHRDRHQLVPGRMEARPRRPGDRSCRGCAASAGSRWPGVRAPARAPSRPGGRARARPPRPSGALAPQCAQHGRVIGDVVPGQRGRLVEYLVCRRHQRFLPQSLFRH